MWSNRLGRVSVTEVIAVEHPANQSSKGSNAMLKSKMISVTPKGLWARTVAVIMTIAMAGSGNLLELAVTAARERATVGEISDALEIVFSRHQAVSPSIAGVYKSAYQGDEEFMSIKKQVVVLAGEVGEVFKVLREYPNGVHYHVRFGERTLMVPEMVLGHLDLAELANK